MHSSHSVHSINVTCVACLSEYLFAKTVKISRHQYCAYLLFIIDQQLHSINSLITYDLLLHVSTLICHLQGALCAWLKLHRLLILIKCNC